MKSKGAAANPIIDTSNIPDFFAEFAGRIVVGAGKTVTTFRDRKKTFTEASLFSSAAFDGPSKEAEADVLRLLQEELQLFSTIIQAVYHGGFDFLVYADMNFRT